MGVLGHGTDASNRLKFNCFKASARRPDPTRNQVAPNPKHVYCDDYATSLQPAPVDTSLPQR